MTTWIHFLVCWRLLFFFTLSIRINNSLYIDKGIRCKSFLKVFIFWAAISIRIIVDSIDEYFSHLPTLNVEASICFQRLQSYRKSALPTAAPRGHARTGWTAIRSIALTSFADSLLKYLFCPFLERIIINFLSVWNILQITILFDGGFPINSNFLFDDWLLLWVICLFKQTLVHVRVI